MSKINNIVKFLEDLIEKFNRSDKEPQLYLNPGYVLNEEWVKWFARKFNVSLLTARQVGNSRLTVLKLGKRKRNIP